MRGSDPAMVIQAGYEAMRGALAGWDEVDLMAGGVHGFT
jgi:hypothetical protein